jgi:hypothetical protein
MAMARPIGYYVHHHGDGHRQRALAIARAAGGDVTLLGTGLAGRTGTVPTVDLPDDRLPAGAFDGRDQGGRPSALHYAPIDHDGIRGRVALVTDWIARNRPALFVVDVSVEIAMLARLASVPTVYVRLAGHRVDRPHLDAFRGATALLAPFHADLDDPRVPAPIRRLSFYAPGIVEPTILRPGEVEDDVVLVVVGRGGGASDGARWAAAAAAVPGMRWRVIGPCTVPPVMPSNLDLRGWVDDAQPMIPTAGVVVGAAGDGLVGSVIAHRRPFVCLPEPRPFDEQLSKARQLAATGAAVVRVETPSPADWPGLIREAQGLDPDILSRLDRRDGAERVARWLHDLVDTPELRSRTA